MEPQEDSRRELVEIGFGVTDDFVRIDEEHPAWTEEELKSCSVVCTLFLTVTDRYPRLVLDDDDDQYNTVTNHLDIAWIDYDEGARLALLYQFYLLGIDHPYLHQQIFKLFEIHQSRLLNDQDYLRNRLQANTRKSLRIDVNLIVYHDDHHYFEDLSECRVVPTAKFVIDSLEKMDVDSLDALARSQNCTICFEEISTERLATKLPCKHIFHDGCVVKWLQSNHFCPLCRFDMPVDS